MEGHRQFGLLVAMCAIALGASGAGQSSPGTPDRPSEPPRIQLDDFRRLQAAGAVLIVDVRDVTAFKRGHIPHAISVPLDQIEARAAEIEVRARQRPIVTYCSCPNDHASASAAALLTSRGLHDVRALAGGLPAWLAAGGSLLRGGLVSQELPKRLF
jgi:rhodanese-related sulfurtransferase